MKLSEAIEKTKLLKPNAFGDDAILLFINELEAQAQSEIMHVVPANIVQYSLPDDKSKTLLIPLPFDICYILWIAAKMDWENKEFESYNQNSMLFNNQYQDYMAWYQRNAEPDASTAIKITNFE